MVLFLFLVYLLIFPAESQSAAREGTRLWLFVLLPTLLPFMILTNAFIKTELPLGLRKRMESYGRMLFGTSFYGTYAVVFGLLCGYPLGARLTGQLYTDQKITQKEACYLLSAINQPSPVFLTAFIGQTLLEGSCTMFSLLAPFYLSIGINLFCSRIIYGRFGFIYEHKKNRKELTIHTASLDEVIRTSIWDSLYAIALIGGYVLLFSVLSSSIGQIFSKYSYPHILLTGCLELSNGISLLGNTSLSLMTQKNLALIFSSLGGICIFAQTKGLMSGSSLTMRPYVMGKLHQTFILILILLVSQII